MKTSKFLSLGAMDLIKGAIVAAGTAAAISIKPIVSSGRLPTKEEAIGAGIAGLSALGAYLLKNLFTNSKNEIGKPE